MKSDNLMDSPLPVGEFLDRASKRLKTDMAADEIERLRAELAAAIKQRDEAHGLIQKWRFNLVDVVDHGEYMDAMTSEARIRMDDADKRAFLAAARGKGCGE